MLARTFKTAAELNLTGEQFCALARLLGMMERGEIRHVKRQTMGDGPPKRSSAGFPVAFNMDTFHTVAPCGTVCCIAGWAVALGGKGLISGSPSGSPRDKELEILFLPHMVDVDVDYDKITVAQAAGALRNYLTTGQARWDEVLGC